MVCALQDVLEEVNADYSNSIEFYEYLLLSKKCLDLTGARNNLVCTLYWSGS